MMRKEVYPAVLELDPELWKHLPKELLERAICKLPFASLVAFRAVCKDWYSVLVPFAAPQIRTSGLSKRLPTLFYFNDNRDNAESPLWWFQVSNNMECPRGTVNEFHLSSFPRTIRGEYTQLLASEGGLLFFGFIRRVGKVVRDFVVCNPLTGKSKLLGLPRSVGFVPVSVSEDIDIFVGVAIYGEMGSYQFVAAGADELGGYPTFVYDSSTCTWTEYPSLLMDAVVDVVGEEVVDLEMRRVTYCNGNLYWYTYLNTRTGYGFPSYAIFKFDVASHIWTVMMVPDSVSCCYTLYWWGQMASYHGEVLLWHIHQSDVLHRRIKCPPSCRDRVCPWTCCGTWASDRRSSTELQLHPELKLLSQDMIAKIEKIFYFKDSNVDHSRTNYISFGQGDVLYHIRELVKFTEPPTRYRTRYRSSVGAGLKIVLQDGNDISCTEFTSGREGELLRAHNVWLFSASLTSEP